MRSFFLKFSRVLLFLVAWEKMVFIRMRSLRFRSVVMEFERGRVLFLVVGTIG